MKKISTILLVIACYTVSAQTTLLHYWNFNGVVNSSAPYDTAQSVILKPNYSIGGASLNYAGAYTDGVTGDTVNQRIPVANWLGLQNALRLRATYGPFTMSLPTTGYNNIVVKYGVYRSTSGSAFNTVTYTTDGVKWDSAGLIITVGTTAPTVDKGTYLIDAVALPTELVTLDFSKIVGVNNNPKFQVQLNFDAANTKGNDRYDNISVEGAAVGLPLLLQSFNGGLVNGNASLWWETSNEVNVKCYEVEKSIDTKSYQSLAIVPATNAAGQSNYQYADANVKGVAYYRLKMIDNNGSYRYSPVVLVNGNASLKVISLFPNPAINTITIKHGAYLAGAKITISNEEGKILMLANILSGTNQTNIDVHKLTKGTYFIATISKEAKQVAQFVKE
ncbi:T9SS type A sorting domain-containing protein [Parasediminibacterium sp. JCM 36343]|uniref:T9SS type A sorting domain-containing protein n=1 Tax=Parasediminibacterium sp. JCM 36343 TaxID=3374279 RepID=UPI00397A568D